MREFARNVGQQLLVSDRLEDLKILVAGALRIRGVGDVFAQIIETRGHARIVATACGGDGFLEGFAGHKAPGHAAGSAVGSEPGAEIPVFGKLEKRGA